MGLDEFTKRNRMIYFSGDFNEKNTKDTVETLLELSCLDPLRDIILIIDSYGGYVDSFTALHDMIQMVPCDVATVCIGKAMSCGQMLLMSGTKGKRFITPNSRVMVHQVSSGASGKFSDLENSIKETSRLDKLLQRLMFKHTKIKKKEMKNKFMHKDTYLTPDQCIKYGIADSILTTPSQFHKVVKKGRAK